MKTSIKLILGLFYTIVTFVCAEKDIEKLVDDYARWYDRRSQEASEFIFPTNARIHEVENKTLQGKFCFYNIFKSFLFNRLKRVSCEFIFTCK